jgi:hypothetical protein
MTKAAPLGVQTLRLLAYPCSPPNARVCLVNAMRYLISRAPHQPYGIRSKPNVST